MRGPRYVAGLARSHDGRALYVAENLADSLAVVDVATRRVVQRLGTGAYPYAVVAAPDGRVYVSDWGGATVHVYRAGADGCLAAERPIDVGRHPSALALSARVRRANGRDTPRAAGRYPPIEHVVYVIKENRTYDQVLGDLRQGDGDTALTFFPCALSPNHHALAERFGIYDRFFTNAEVSRQGHPWSTSGYVTDYVEKTTPDVYRLQRHEPAELADVDQPAVGHLWDAAARRHLWLRNYGESAEPMPRARRGGRRPRAAPRDGVGAGVRALLPALQPYTSPTYPPFDMAVPDQRRADAWLAEFREHVRAGRMPALEVVLLPNDHLAGARAGLCTPRACMADNDLALGRIVEALSRSRFWRSTAVFVLEDDAQAGPDHVDSHRSVLLTISPWAQGGVRHRFANTTDVLATIEELLGLPAFSAFDRFGRPLREIWRASPDVRPYTVLAPAQSLAEVNLAAGPDARRSAHLDLAHPDRVDDATFNRIAWRAVKGAATPYPSPHRVASDRASCTPGRMRSTSSGQTPPALIACPFPPSGVDGNAFAARHGGP